MVQAKLDQKNARVSVRMRPYWENVLFVFFSVLWAQLEVESFIGRDIKMDALAEMVEKLDGW